MSAKHNYWKQDSVLDQAFGFKETRTDRAAVFAAWRLTAEG